MRLWSVDDAAADSEGGGGSGKCSEDGFSPSQFYLSLVQIITKLQAIRNPEYLVEDNKDEGVAKYNCPLVIIISTIQIMDSDDDDRFQVNPQFHRDLEEEDEDHHNKSYTPDESSSSEEESETNLEMNERQRLEFDILQEAIKNEKSTPYQDQITRELIDKLNDLTSAALHKNGQELVNIKIQELALNKLLVLNYAKSDFRLVLAHYHLGEAYLNYECYEQAIEHITIAIHKSQKLAEELPQTKALQINIHISLAEAFMAQRNYDDAIDTLNKADIIQQRLSQQAQREGGQVTRNVKGQILKAQCFCKQKNFTAANDVIDEVIEYTKGLSMGKIEYAFALVDKANILAEMGSKELYKAIQYQEEGINILVNENYPKPEEVAELYSTLSSLYEKINNSENSLTCIQKVKTLYEELYSPEDKRVIKARRKIATALLKSERYKEAVTQLLEIAKLEEKVFGQTLHLARTLKLLGTVYSSLGIGDSKVYLKRAMAIFQSSGNKKQAQELKEKLRHLISEHPTGEMDVNIISQQEI